jgi:hypothetical protein
MWEPRRLTNLWASTACYRDSVTFLPLLPLLSVLCSWTGGVLSSQCLHDISWTAAVKLTSCQTMPWAGIEYTTFCIYCCVEKNIHSTSHQDTSVCVATRLWGEDGTIEVWVPIGGSDFSLIHSVQTNPWSQSSLLGNGYLRLFPRGLKRPGRDYGYSPQCTVTFKYACRYAFTPLMVWCLIKQKANLDIGEIMAVYSENRTKHVNIFCR